MIQLQQALKHVRDDEKREQIQDWLAKLGGNKDKDKSKSGG